MILQERKQKRQRQPCSNGKLFGVLTGYGVNVYLVVWNNRHLFALSLVAAPSSFLTGSYVCSVTTNRR